ncbi:hypothetical protein [Azohydromonas lata]|uniref:Uncharacterized protein n=1 Tax=Azohydromonas lata TaxID=45677 RepID=A0ABU5IK32_9BURK|nr:hypothetical protein [Azohydromonas lata]MDZ5459253.1 hypothetical protein [Azohydromonas lata]
MNSLSSNALSFNSTFGTLPVEIQYEVEISEDHRGSDFEIIPLACIVNGHEIDLCEDAGLFHADQLKSWLAQAEAAYKGLLADDSEPNQFVDLDYEAARAEDRFIAERERVHHARMGF